MKYGKHTISFLVERKPRKSLKISVLPDLSVQVLAPIDTPITDVLDKVKKRAHWILKQKDHFNNFLPKELPRKYVSGETHRYLGKQYRLKILSADENDVKLIGKYITIFSREKDDTEYNRKQLYKWYRKHAEIKYSNILNACLEKLRKYGVEKPNIQIKILISRWGSCVPNKNKILLNTNLIKAPSHCIEYVITHELCHLKHQNHDKQFYEFLTLVMPDWKKRKEKLEGVFF